VLLVLLAAARGLSSVSRGLLCPARLVDRVDSKGLTGGAVRVGVLLVILGGNNEVGIGMER
jgi:hypothetical protein